MISHRKLKGVDLFQVLEFVGPTHNADVMMPELKPEELVANQSWLYPNFWMPDTNRMVFSMHLNVLKTASEIVIIDTGVGNHKRRPPSPSQHQLNTPLLDWLRGIGCPPERVGHVVLTHLHGDHVGWNTVREGDRWVPAFPNATYYFPELDWKHYSGRFYSGNPDPKGSFADSVLPIAEAGLHRFIHDGNEIAGLLKAIHAPGHTPGQLMYLAETDGEFLLFAADTIHSPIQVVYPHVNTRACEDLAVARATRLSMLSYAAERQCDVLPAHYFGVSGWKIIKRNGGYRAILS